MKIIVAIDESPCSEAALEALMNRIWKADTEVLLLNVLQPMTSQYEFASGFAVGPLLEPDPREVVSGKKLIGDTVLKLKTVFAKELVFGKVAEGDPADIIIDTAKTWDADLILVGSHGRKGLEKFFLGSVAEKVAKSAQCSVEIVRRKMPKEMTGIELELRSVAHQSTWQDEAVC